MDPSQLPPGSLATFYSKSECRRLGHGQGRSTKLTASGTSANGETRKKVCLVSLVFLVYLVCLVGFGNETDRTTKRTQRTKLAEQAEQTKQAGQIEK